MKDSKDITGDARFDAQLEKHGISIIKCANCNANLYVKSGTVQQDEVLCPLCTSVGRENAHVRQDREIPPLPQKKDPLLLRLVSSGLHWLKN